MTDFIFIIPAGGVASRLRPLRYPKELLPVVFTRADDGTGHFRPVVAIECTLSAMMTAGLRKGIIVTNTDKLELQKYLGNGSELGLSLVYAIQPKATGLPQAIDLAGEWTLGSNVCLALPDTVFRPETAIAQICDALRTTGADLVLGVFPTEHPEKLGPVSLRDDGTVVRVQDKPANSSVKNTWGIAAWRPSFTALLRESVRAWEDTDREHELTLGSIFENAIDVGLRVRAVNFADGQYNDVGTPEGISAWIASSVDEIHRK
ncbi:MAG TPA: sugar phosphate nucleotidyltransferase [Candidatus Cybelea sp.]|nr:sugar phosphate nucleotidyltransferase [Candidatus Cybelea sp.]